MLINPRFNIDKDMAIIKTKKYLEILDMKSKRGVVKVLDEFGVGMNHRAWYSFLNQSMSYVMQTHGHEGKVIIVTSPYDDYVDKDARKLFDMIVEMLKKNDKKRYATARIAEMQYNQKMKKIYYKYPRGRFENGVVKRVNAFKIKYPPKDIMERYFKTQSEIKLSLKSELAKEAVSIEVKKTVGKFRPEDYIEKIRAEPEKFVKELFGRRYINREYVMNEFYGIGDTRARQIKALAEKVLKEELNLGRIYEKRDIDTGGDNRDSIENTESTR